jgi:hypothetical protein
MSAQRPITDPLARPAIPRLMTAQVATARPGHRDRGGFATAGGAKASVIMGVAALALLAAACGSGGGASQQAPAAPPAATRASMLTSLSADHGAAWAVLEVGGSRAEHNNFWQLLIRPSASAPPAVPAAPLALAAPAATATAPVRPAPAPRPAWSPGLCPART